jgi:hypothetical protein
MPPILSEVFTDIGSSGICSTVIIDDRFYSRLFRTKICSDAIIRHGVTISEDAVLSGICSDSGAGRFDEILALTVV